ncbi:hypothetical protein BGP_4403 [Beggiatoa sp. PS]|nr:hypothetical protein BGP_4403 [Beggiatoa sp. PS]
MTDNELKELVGSLAIAQQKTDEKLVEIIEQQKKIVVQLAKIDVQLASLQKNTEAGLAKSSYGQYPTQNANKKMSKKEIIKIKEDTSWREIISFYRYDILSKHGFSEGENLLPEEEPFVEQARNKLLELMGIIENRWKPVPSFSDCPYIFFENLETKQNIEFYDLDARARRLINLRIDEILDSVS